MPSPECAPVEARRDMDYDRAVSRAIKGLVRRGRWVDADYATGKAVCYYAEDQGPHGVPAYLACTGGGTVLLVCAECYRTMRKVGAHESYGGTFVALEGAK